MCQKRGDGNMLQFINCGLIRVMIEILVQVVAATSSQFPTTFFLHMKQLYTENKVLKTYRKSKQTGSI
jgi:hypothetical protein